MVPMKPARWLLPTTTVKVLCRFPSIPFDPSLPTAVIEVPPEHETQPFFAAD